jgi:hypothetical protein
MMEESLRLIAFQQQLEKDLDGGTTFVGLSVTQTIRACLVAGLSKKAERLRSDFKVPDKRYVLRERDYVSGAEVTPSDSGTRNYMLSLKLKTLMDSMHLQSPNAVPLVTSLS